MKEYEEIMSVYKKEQVESGVTEVADKQESLADDGAGNEQLASAEVVGEDADLLYSTKETIVDVSTIIKALEESSKDSQSTLEKSSEVSDFLSKQEILGLIEIDNIDVKMIVVEGTEWENIRVTIGHMKQTNMFGELGNCALAGHRGGTYGTFFEHIDKLDVGDEIVLTDIKGITYQYYVYDKFVTHPTDMGVIDDVEDERTLTLISCENDGEDRLIVHAKMN